MKTNLENTIKNQLEKRELSVSENAWERLAQMMDEENQPKEEKSLKVKKMNRNLWISLAIAASLALIVGVVWNFNQPSTHQLSRLNRTPIELNSKDFKFPVPLENSNEFRSEVQKIAEVYYVENRMNSKSPDSSESNLPKNITLETPITSEKLAEQKEDFNLSSPTVDAPVEVVVQSENQNEEEKKKNFVDPEMLLYSIENNEAVKQSGNSGKLVLIDFNK